MTCVTFDDKFESSILRFDRQILTEWARNRNVSVVLIMTGPPR